MKAIGLDIGTTKICGILIDSDSGRLLETRTRGNDSTIADTASWEKCQDPHAILAHCQSILQEFREIAGDITCIGITGQMHGILYLDSSGEPVSPLYTWQDERGNQPLSDTDTYASFLTRVTGYSMATGYGLTTHFYMVRKSLVPEKAAVFCTIQDYAAMVFAGASSPLVHISDAASFGLFDGERNMFDLEAMKRAGMDGALLPEVTKETRALGSTSDGMSVAAAIGDNQASFLGSVCDSDAILVNVGTGSQVSARTSGTDSAGDKRIAAGLQIRPLAENDRICVGSPLCGGYSYSVLKEFFTQAASMLGAQPSDLYHRMDTAAQDLYPAAQPLQIDTRFRGTREDPGIRGRIENISPANLTPGHLCLGVLTGICSELFAFYKQFPSDAPRTGLIGSGNGIRRSPLLQRIISDTFGLPLRIPLYEEEAAYGAALFCLVAGGVCSTLAQAQQKIRYQTKGEEL